MRCITSENRTARARRRPGFTLIEVLVVVAIIALLIAILLPSLAAAREQSRRAICSTRLHNIGLANQIYANENKGKILECHSRRKSGGGRKWTQIAISARQASRSNPLASDPPWYFVDWRAQFKKYKLDKETLECPNRPRSFGWEGVATLDVEGFTVDQLITQGYLATTTGGSGETVPFRHWLIGYQYFGGIREWSPWSTPGQTFKSRSPVDNNALGQWALAADSIIKVDKQWGGLPREMAYGNMPPHAERGRPAGGNVLTFDGAVTWINAAKMVPWHSWGTPDRETYCYQADLGDYGRTQPVRGIRN